MKTFKEIMTEDINATKEPIIEAVEEDAEEDLETFVEQVLMFLEALDPDKLDDNEFMLFEKVLAEAEMLDDKEYDEDDDMEDLEEAQRIKKRIDPKARMERKIKYRKNRARIKQSLKKYRKSAQGKKYAKRSKRMSKLGKTATGKRQSTITNR